MAETNSIVLRPRMKDLTGQRFENWYVIALHSINKWGRTMWFCRCKCGTEKSVAGYDLGSGKSTQCRKCGNTRHGQARSPEYKVWEDMLKRCRNPRCKVYPDYGGRGIAVCFRWQSFEAFHEDMGPRPSPEHSIDRIDNEQGYCKENCRWATPKEQSRNTRTNHALTHDDKTMCVTEWAEETGIAYTTLQYRLAHGWSVERALTEPVHHRHLPLVTHSRDAPS